MRRIVLSYSQERGGTLRSTAAGSRGEHSLLLASASELTFLHPWARAAGHRGLRSRARSPRTAAGRVGQSRGGLGSRRPGLQHPAGSTAALPTPSHGSLLGRPHRASARRRPRSQFTSPAPWKRRASSPPVTAARRPQPLARPAPPCARAQPAESSERR